MVWSSNVLIALLFALLHLAPAAQLLDLPPVAVVWVIALATVAGALFGWIFARHGLLMAAYTHGVAGVLVYLGGRGLIEMYLD